VTATLICVFNIGGTLPDWKAFQAVVILPKMADTELQSRCWAASKMLSAPADKILSSGDAGPGSASVGTASATASRSPPGFPVENSP